MITIRKSNDRGHVNHGWLDTHHTFSFASYYDPKHMGFRSLRVINEDHVAAGRGFGAHPHQDMEIITYVKSGKLAHKDSMGNGEQLGPNEIQRMSAGTGVYHSEYNGSTTEPVHLFQIWIEPKQRGIKPSYEQFPFDASEKQNRFKVLASSNPVAGAATINQDATVSVAEIAPETKLRYDIEHGGYVWLHVVEGELTVNGQKLETGDAAAISEEKTLDIASGNSKSEVLVFDLA